MAFSADMASDTTHIGLREQAAETERLITDELNILDTIQDSLMELFPEEERSLARQALCDPLAFLGIDTQWTAPNPNSLPYLLALMHRASGMDMDQFVSGLHAVHTDVRNIRRVNEEGGETTGNFAIAFNLASMYSLPFRSPDNPLSIAIRYRGDEILVITHAPTPVHLEKSIGRLEANNARSISRLKQVSPGIKKIDCTLDMDAPKWIREITIRPPLERHGSKSLEGMRALDLVADLYNQDTSGADAEQNYATLKSAIMQAEQTEYTHDPLSAAEYANLPQYLKRELEKAKNSPRAREFAHKAAYNEMFPRGDGTESSHEETVYNPRPFLHRLCETVWENRERKYRLIMAGPPELKSLNAASHDNGDHVLISTNRRIRQVFGDSAIVHQSRGSFFALVEADDTFEEKISSFQDTLSEEAILHPENHLDDPAIAVSVVDGEIWDDFVKHVLVENEKSAADSNIHSSDLTDSDPDWPEKYALDFWGIVDSQRPPHYTQELLQVMRNVQPESITKVIYERFVTRVNIVRELLIKSAKLSAVDLDLLTTIPTQIASMDDFVGYLTRINDLCRRITLEGETMSIRNPQLGLHTLENTADFLSVSRPDKSLTNVARPWKSLTVPR